MSNRKKSRNAVRLYDTPGFHGSGLVITHLITDDPADDDRPILVEMTPSMARRWAESLMKAADNAEQGMNPE